LTPDVHKPCAHTSVEKSSVGHTPPSAAQSPSIRRCGDMQKTAVSPSQLAVPGPPRLLVVAQADDLIARRRREVDVGLVAAASAATTQ
jgi:hypothetical protein